jgi:SHS2 domain-containing protein
MSPVSTVVPRWEHFEHGSDIGVRGVAATLAGAFEQAALALMAVCVDPGRVLDSSEVAIECAAADLEILLVRWLDALIYEMAVRGMLFARFAVRIDGTCLSARAFGEPVDVGRHAPAVEIKGATLCELSVACRGGVCTAQCVVDV